MRDVSTSLDMTKGLLEDKRTSWVVAALICLLFVTANLPWQLDDYDQAKQAFTSLEMVKAGHWLYQNTPHERVATKPPFVGWISAVVFGVIRSWELAWRLPSIFAAIALAILLFRAAASTYGLVAGLIAVSAFGFNSLTPRLASLVRTDMPLALVIFLLGLLIWQKIRTREPWNARDRLIIFAVLTAAMLIKGPIVYAFLLPGIAAFAWRRRKQQEFNAGMGWWPWLASLGIFLIWVIGGIAFQPGFFDQVVVREFAGRFGETIHRPQPFYFYLPHLLQKFAPWSVLMIATAIVDLRSIGWKFRRAFRRMSPETLWLICWSFGGLVAMSLIPSKRVDRIFPVIPPLCLLLAAQLGGALRREQTRSHIYLWSAMALVLSILFTTGYVVAKVVTGYRDHHDALVHFGSQVRTEAEEHHWRYGIIWGGHEGLLVYLRKLRFLKEQEAVVEWNRGNLDALVVPTAKAPNLMRQLHDAALSESTTGSQKNEPQSAYILIRR